MASYDPNEPNFYTGFSWVEEEQKWYVAWNAGPSYWEGPYEKVLEKLPEIQRRYMKQGIWKKGKIIKHQYGWRLTFA